MAVEMTKVSTKGQVVIPQGIRDRLKLEEGSTLSVSSKDNLIVLKKIEDPLEEDDLKTLEEIKDAWKEIEEGKYKKKSSSDFLKEIASW